MTQPLEGGGMGWGDNVKRQIEEESDEMPRPGYEVLEARGYF